MRFFRRVFIFLLIFSLAIFLRLFRFPELSWFFGDQGIDLMVAQRALRDGVWPMVGPYLRVNNFFVPPTYYWLLTIFLWIGKSPEMVTLFFIGIDMATLLVLYWFVRSLVDRETGLIAMFLYAASALMVDRARSMWQPHPIQLFLVAALYALSLAVVRKKKQGVLFVAAWSLYGIALSIYPSPIVLLPFFLYHTRQFVKHIKTVCLAILGFFLPFIPWIIFEMQHEYPTYAAIFTGSFGQTRWQEMSIQFFLNIFGLVSEVSNPWPLHFWKPVLIVPLTAALFILGFVLAQHRFRRDPQFGRAFSFLSPMWLFMGFASLLLYREMSVMWHRLWGFLPFVFLAFALMLRVGARWPSITYRSVIACLVGLYLLGNGLTLYGQVRYGAGRDDNQIFRARRVASAIDASARRKGLEDSDFSVIAYTPTDVSSYAVTPELYFLREFRDYPVAFTWAGNDLDRAVWGKDNRRYIYLLCKEYAHVEDVEHTCLGTFGVRNPSYTQEERLLFIGDTTAFVFRRNDQ